MSLPDNSATIRPLKPSEVFQAILAAKNANVAVMNWGPPGVAKSAIGGAVANHLGIAFADVRLSQMDPSHLRGIPFKTQIGSMEGVRWSVPFVMPKDINHQEVITIPHEVEEIVWFLNPLGSNGIPYITDPKIEVNVVGRNDAIAKVIETAHDHFSVALFRTDDNGQITDEMVSGKVRVRIQGKARALLALEEINSSAPSVQAAAYQLVLDKRLGEYIVPEGVFIVGMGNRDQDKAVTFKMGSALSNRFTHIETVVNFPEWQVWAITNQINSAVIGYLSAFNQELFNFKPGETTRAFATPRSWEMVSKIIDNNDDLPEGVKLALIVGAVGNSSGSNFMQHYKFAEQMPRAEDVLSGAVKMMPKIKDENGREIEQRSNIGVGYQMTTTLCYKLKSRVDELRQKHGIKEYKKSKDFNEWAEQCDRYLEFILRNFPPEIAIMGAKAAVAIHNLPFDVAKMPYFKIFCDRFEDLILS